MKIDKAMREAARHKKTEAVDSFVESQKDEPVHSYSEGNKTLYRSGVVIRNDKNVGHEAMQRARELLNNVSDVIIARPKTVTGTNDVWFKKHQLSVEQQIMQKILVSGFDGINAQDLATYGHSITKFIINENGDIQQEQIDLEHYQPQIDDDAPDYVPLSER